MFGALLREIRQSQNRTLDQVAQLLSRGAGTPVSRDQVLSWESGELTPDATDLGHLAVALEVPQLLLETALAEQTAVARRIARSVSSPDDYGIGHRMRHLRHWRGLSLEVVAGLSGISASYLSLIENGYRAVTKRSLLEAIAAALRVSPGDLTDKPWDRGDADATQADVTGIVSALDAYELGHDPGVPVREWPAVEADVKLSEEWMHVHGDYASIANLAPRLLGELHSLYVTRPELRREVLLGLVQVYKQAAIVAKYFGGGGSTGMSLVAAMAAQRCADELESPQWRAVATWHRVNLAGPINRTRQYQRAVSMAEELSPALGDPEVFQAYGMLHLSAAMAAAAQSDRDTAMAHLEEASAMADRQEAEVGSFAMMWFGRTNVGIWRTSIALELGDGAAVAEAARAVQVEVIPSPKRQSDFFADVGRSLLAEKPTREQGLGLLLRAERLAPQKVRNSPFVREAVGDALRSARRAAGGAELRGLAHRLGLGPSR